MTCLTGLHHVSLHVKDIDAAEAFYRDILGFETVKSVATESGTRLVFIKLGSLVLELTQPSDPAKRAQGIGSLQHVAINTTDIDQAVAELKAKGVVFQTDEIIENELLNARLIFLDGPEGEMIELFEDN